MSAFTIQEEDYRTHPALSQSDLKLILEHPSLFKAKIDGKLERKTSSGFHLGSLVDTRITAPAEFDRLYIKCPSDLKTPSSPNQKQFCDGMLRGLEAAESYSEAYAVGKKTPEAIEQLAEELASEYDDYLNFESAREGRVMYSAEDELTMLRCIAAVKEHPRAGKLMFGNASVAPEFDGEDVIQAFNQLGIVFSLPGLDGKALLDRVVIDHGLRIVYNIDLKTTGKPLKEFPKWYRLYGYDFQQVWYGMGLRKYLNSLKDEMFRDYPDPSEYKIKTICVVVETGGLNNCAVFQPSEKLLNEAVGKVKEAVGLYSWHYKEDQWAYTRNEVENNYTRFIHPYNGNQ